MAKPQVNYDQMLTVLESGPIDPAKLRVFRAMLRTAIAKKGDPVGRGAEMLKIIDRRLHASN